MHTILSSLKDINENRFEYAFLFFQLLFFAKILFFLTTDTALVANFILTVIYFLLKNKKIDKNLFTFTYIYLLLFLIPLFFFPYFSPIILLGGYLRLVIAYLTIRALGEKFIIFFENIVFFLALISLPFFIVQLLNPSFFKLFQPLNFSSKSRFSAGHVNLFIFHLNTWALRRNSGFMAEPAMFGCVLAWATIINIFKNSFRFNFKLMILFIAMVTTFSLGTYIYLAIFVFLYFLNKNMNQGIVSLVFLCFLLLFISKIGFFQEQYEFMDRKRQGYQESAEIGAERVKPGSVSRNAGFELDLKYFLKFPLGYGFYRNQFKYPNMAGSPCGLSRYFIKWGIIGILFLLIGQFKYLKYLSRRFSVQFKCSFLFAVIFLMTMYGNPIDYKPFFAMFLLYGFCEKINYNSIKYLARRN